MKKSRKLLLCFVALLPFSLHVKAEHTHTWSDWEVTCPATCNYEGVKVRYCTECYEEDAEDIPATGKHNWSKWHIEDAGCFTSGSKTRYCEYCDKEETIEIPAYGLQVFHFFPVSTYPVHLYPVHWEGSARFSCEIPKAAWKSVSR